MQPEVFQGRESFVELGHLDNYFVRNTRKKAPTGKYFFLLDTLKITFWMENLTQKWTQLGPFFFQNKGIFFDLKKRRDAHPLSLVCNLYVWLYMHIRE